MSAARRAQNRGKRPEAPAAVDPSSVEQWSGFLLYRLAEISREMYHEYSRSHNLLPTQVGVLQIVRSSGAIIQGVAAKAIGVNAPAMTSLIDDLRQRGFITRSAHAEDGRANVIRLTEHGLSALRELDTLNQEAEAELLSALTKAERATLHRLLHKVYSSHLTRARGDSGGTEGAHSS